jgi:glycosyltransferase involved in cell wall biosynthesis
MDKRINLLKKHYDVTLIYWNRETLKIWELQHKDIETKEIRIKAHYTNPLKRIVPTCIFAIKVVKYLIGIKPNIIYTENIDMLSICNIYCILGRNIKIIYEIADLNKLIIDKPVSIAEKVLKNILVTIEKHLFKKVDLLILTSKKFYDVYYKKFIDKEKVLFMPNIPDINVFNSYIKKNSGRFTVGFIGAIRYKDQMKMLIKASEACGINILFAGEGLDDEIKKICIGKKYIEYYGRYNYKSEIAQLYSKVDCIYSVYNAELNNVKVALPNKLYESIFCALPIIVAKGTYLAELVEKLGVGIAVDHKDLVELKGALLRLANDKEYYNSKVEACYKYKREIDISKYNELLLSKIGKT